MKHKLHVISVLCLVAVMLQACTEHHPLDVDVSKIEAGIHIERLDQELFETKSEDLARFNRECIQRYGELWETYVSVMLRAGTVRDSLIDVNLDRFIHDPSMLVVYDDIQKKYKDLGWLETELSDAFKHLKFYYPDSKIPRIVTYNSAFNFGVATFQEMVGIGLDMYLGPENGTVKNISIEMIPQFLKDKMLKEYITVDVMRGWFETNYMEELPSGSDFLSNMVYQGKIMYALDALMPAKPPHIKIRYTAEKYGWCLQHENEIWRDIVDLKILYSTNPNEIRKFIEEAPFTSSLPQESPGRVGVFMGWQMVKAYMEAFPEKKLPDLMQEQNARNILKYYKPKK